MPILTQKMIFLRHFYVTLSLLCHFFFKSDMAKVLGIATLFGFYVTFALFFIYLYEEKIKYYKRVYKNFFKSDMGPKIYRIFLKGELDIYGRLCVY